MSTDTFSASVHTQGDTQVITLKGDINGFAEEALNKAYAETENSLGSKITLDFSAVVYINSTGIALIVGLLAKARTSRRSIVASGLSDHYKEIFTITRLSDFMELK